MYNPRPIQEKDKAPAWAWYKQHRSHVDRMLAGCRDSAYPPCGSDCIRPELWKPEHWKWLLENAMNIVLTQFAADRHFDPDKAGTTITDRSAEQFGQEIRECSDKPMPGYAPFCKLLFMRNWTNAHVGTIPILPHTERFLKSGYSAREENELPVLVRWFEGIPIETPELLARDFITIPRAEYLCLVLYSKEHLAKEGTDIGDADYGVVAILGQMHDQEEPMPPATAMRNALGIKEGGSGVPIDRDAYARSVEFWNSHAVVKVTL